MDFSYSFNIGHEPPKTKNINTSEYWDEIWKIESRETWRIYPETNKRIVEIIGSNKEVLEIGCGVGVLLKQIMNNNNEVTGIDISSFAISLLKEDGIRGIQSILPNIPLDDNIFDIVVGTEILEHMDNDKELLMQCNRVCKNGGKIIFVVPDNCLGPDEESEHMRKYTYGELHQLLSLVSKDVFIQKFTDSFTTIFKGRKINISIPQLIGIITKE
jgi:2-polyprenyl-3-methyl-5-hydroxy-6-metoxy-1,4-benzoquinol methylase